MTAYWIRDHEGVYAQVEGVDQRDMWTRVRGWAQAGEPGQNDQVHVVHAVAGQGRIPYAALSSGWADLGWRAGPPPAPVDVTKDPQLVDPPAPVAAPEQKPATKAAAGGAKNQE